jgi:transcriptional regulator with XRE-family HTH domain
MSEFGEKLINLRTERGLSVKEACRKVGIPQSRLSELERGVRIPTTGQITNLENFYETGSDELAKLAKLNTENLNW